MKGIDNMNKGNDWRGHEARNLINRYKKGDPIHGIVATLPGRNLEEVEAMIERLGLTRPKTTTNKVNGKDKPRKRGRANNDTSIINWGLRNGLIDKNPEEKGGREY